jgi:hypothetical protein
MSSTPPKPQTAPALERLSELHGDPPQRRLRRELIIFGLPLLFGLVGMPFLIWYGGNRFLGPYTHGQNLHGGPFALLQDFYLGLLHGSAVFWVIALGPPVLLLLLRLLVWVVRAIPPRERD